jgi:outer membrane biosynthesis protein TonB
MKFSIEKNEQEVALPGEVHLHIRFRPANLSGILLVVLMHAVLLYFLLNQHLEQIKKKGDDAGSRAVTLLLDKQTMAKLSQPEKQKAAPRPKAPKPAPRTPSVTKPSPVPAVTEQPSVVQAPPPPPAEPAPATDMLAMLNAAREKRKAAEDSAAKENQAASQGSRPMSAQEIAEANIRRSMRQAAGDDGTSGVFQVLDKSTRVGRFAFNGWKANSNRKIQQVIEVDAGLGGNVELAMVRRMIDLIREHYQGDFRWESRRMGKVIAVGA